MADSIDQTQHVIYDDTAALGLVIRQPDNPIGRVFKHSTLGKAYYYMGRNHSLSNRIAEAAKCYSEADRLHIDDPIYRGRVNSCMGYICRQNNNDSLALIFYENSSQFFKESNNEWYYAHSILNISYHLINLSQYNQADSLLRFTRTISIDSTYTARYYEIKGLYFYKQQQYDSALVYFNQALNYWHSEEEKCFSYLKIMQSYYFRDKNIEYALPFALRLISFSNSPGYIHDAYYCLIKNAQQNGDADLVSKYASTREDINRLLRKQKDLYTQSVMLLEEYISNPNPLRWFWTTLLGVTLLCIILIFSIIIYRKHSIIHLQVATNNLQEATEKIEELSTCLEKQAKEQKNNFYNPYLLNILKRYPTPPNRWNEYALLKKDVDPYLHDWLIALENLKLTNREKVFCIFIFIYRHLPISEVADYMNITNRAVRVLKTRVAQKLGITSVELIDYLQKLTNAD
jgi:tetratricopeptide (TPR) repeat protein